MHRSSDAGSSRIRSFRRDEESGVPNLHSVFCRSTDFSFSIFVRFGSMLFADNLASRTSVNCSDRCPGDSYVVIQVEKGSSSKSLFHRACCCHRCRISRYGHAVSGSISVSATPAGITQGGCRSGSLFLDRRKNPASAIHERGLLASIFSRHSEVLQRIPAAVRRADVLFDARQF
jgi:hypothetical protein